MYSLNTLLFFLLIKKLIKSGKQRTSISLKQDFILLVRNTTILKQSILNLIVPIKFNFKKIGVIQYQIPVVTHYYNSLKLAITWLIKAATLKKNNKTSFAKALYLECHEVLKQQGIAYTLKQQYIKKALTNRIFLYLITSKKVK